MADHTIQKIAGENATFVRDTATRQNSAETTQKFNLQKALQRKGRKGKTRKKQQNHKWKQR